ncbi:MAG: hypothetical protein KAI55_04025, partial [Candidatus Aenigmarchaeota archaeon]|nr:hypothetical protein [Candidatus Aenigmarchaeota archaeon]
FENYIGGLCDFIQRNMKCKIIVLTNIWTNHSDELSYANKKNIVRIKKDIALHKVGSIHNVESPCLITIDKDVHLENAIKIFSRVLKFEVIRTKNSFSGLIFETLKKLNISTTLEEVISLSRKISIPYRMEQIPCKKGKIILDSAYTKIKLQKVIRYLKNHFPDKKIIPFTCLIKDEHQKEFFDTMNKQFDKIILTYMNPKKFPDFSKDIFYTVNEINTYIKQQQKSNIFKLYLDPILAFKTEKSELKSNEILIIFGFPMLPKLISDEIGRNNKNVVSKKQLCYQKIKNRD